MLFRSEKREWSLKKEGTYKLPGEPSWVSSLSTNKDILVVTNEDPKDKKKNSIHYICFFLLFITEKYKITTIKNFLISIYGEEKSFSQIFKGLTRAHRIMRKRYETT